LEIVVERSDGVRRNVLVSPSVLSDGRGKITGAINCLHDITERKLTEDALRESEERYRAIVRQSTVGMARTDLKGRLIFVNQKLCQMLGYKESELVGKRIFEITHPNDVAESRRLFQRIVARAEPYEIEKRYIRKDGSALWVSVSASPMRDAAGKTQSAISVILDIGDRKKAQAILEDRARGLEGEILAISDREQRRLGQDLHDGLCQHLTAVAFMARSVALRLKNHRVLQADDIEKIAELINEGVTEARSIARGLHPVEMDPAGLVTALQSLLHRQSNLPYRLDMDEELSIPDPAVALHLYRIAREAVINANKHARAHELVVRMRSSPKQIELSVTDDGIGINKKGRDRGGMGFHIMEYRARSMGARLEIKSVRPQGTRVACYVPRK
jgi:PAS domain S-box-containing protein